MNKRLYVAYGSNLNIRQMKMRCPTAKLYDTGTVEDYELQFKGSPHGAFATIAPKKGACVPVAVWEIEPRDELSLDRYEGYPSHYFKQDVPVQLDGEEITAMVYIMNLKMDFGMPSVSYYQTVYEGYLNCGLDTTLLEQAIGNSTQKYYAYCVQQQKTVFEFEDDDEDYDCDPDNYEQDDVPEQDEPDESDPFYFSDQMRF